MAFGSVDVAANDETQVEASQRITNGDFIFSGNEQQKGILGGANPTNTLLLTVGAVIIIGLISATFLASKSRYPINKKNIKKVA